MHLPGLTCNIRGGVNLAVMECTAVLIMHTDQQKYLSSKKQLGQEVSSFITNKDGREAKKENTPAFAATDTWKKKKDIANIYKLLCTTVAAGCKKKIQNNEFCQEEFRRGVRISHHMKTSTNMHYPHSWNYAKWMKSHNVQFIPVSQEHLIYEGQTRLGLLCAVATGFTKLTEETNCSGLTQISSTVKAIVSKVRSWTTCTAGLCTRPSERKPPELAINVRTQIIYIIQTADAIRFMWIAVINVSTLAMKIIIQHTLRDVSSSERHKKEHKATKLKHYYILYKLLLFISMYQKTTVFQLKVQRLQPVSS